MAETTGNQGKTPLMFCCPVPPGECNGSNNPDPGESQKTHSSHDQVRQCQRKWLLKNGYKQLSRREYQNPHSGRILVLNRRATRAQPGKAGRFMTKPAKILPW